MQVREILANSFNLQGHLVEVQGFFVLSSKMDIL
jgi:hypothetical protein